MNQSLAADVVQEGIVERDEAIVDIAIVGKVHLGVVGQAVVQLSPGVFDEGSGDIAQGR